MTKRNFLFGIISLSLAFTLVFGLWVWASAIATVTATVTVQTLSISVSDGLVDYGSIGTGNEVKSTIELSDTQTVQNTGGIAADVYINGTNSASYALVYNPDPGTDEYAHAFCTSSCSNQNNYSLMYAAPTTTLAYSNLGASNSFNLDLAFISPASITTGGGVQQNVDVTLTAVTAQP